MKLLTVGDSFTYGLELPDPRTQAWPILLANDIGYELTNISYGGASNDMMYRECMSRIISDDYDIIIVGWTDPGRLEVTLDGRPCSINYSPRMKQMFPWIKEYYKKNHSDELAYQRTMCMILGLQSLLKQKNKKYVFCSAFGMQELNRRFSVQSKHLQHEVDACYYIDWPLNGIIEWMGDCEKGPNGHPLELGHRRIKEKIHEHIRHLGWVS